MAEINRPQRKPRLPTVLTGAEVSKILVLLDGTHGVVARLLYGTGMRITEALQLRSKDVDFDRQVIVVREGKGRRRNKSDVPAHIVPAVATSACWREIGGKDRVVMLPHSLAQQLLEQRLVARAQAGHGPGRHRQAGLRPYAQSSSLARRRSTPLVRQRFISSRQARYFSSP